MSENTQSSPAFQLPPELVGAVDLSRLIRELEELNDFMYQTEIRQPGTPMKPPRSSHTLEKVASDNKYSLLDTEHRTKLLQALKVIESHAPIIHISFAVDPSTNFMKKISAWVRENIDRYGLVEVGLQPTIAVGCVVRTENKMFDMSLRNKFHEHRDVLIKKLSEVEAA